MGGVGSIYRTAKPVCRDSQSNRRLLGVEFSGGKKQPPAGERRSASGVNTLEFC